MKVKYKRLGKAISIVFLLVICIFQSNLPGYTGGPLCFLDEMFGGCVGYCSDTPKCQEKLLNKDKSISNMEKARSQLAKSLCFVDENFGSCAGECSGTPKCQEKLRKREKEAIERRRVRIAMGMKKQREIQSKCKVSPGYGE